MFTDRDVNNKQYNKRACPLSSPEHNPYFHYHFRLNIRNLIPSRIQFQESAYERFAMFPALRARCFHPD
jgi:hypothetical protein